MSYIWFLGSFII